LADAAASTGSADQQLAIEELDRPLDFGGRTYDAHPAGKVGGAKPLEFADVEIDGRILEHEARRDIVAEGDDGAAVLRSCVERIARRANVAAAGHVLGDKARITGHVLSHVPAQHPCPGVIDAAGFCRDNEFDLPAFVEITDGLRRCGSDPSTNKQCP
jgi:hypothetical protein